MPVIMPDKENNASTGATDAIHRHNVHVFVYVLEGSRNRNLDSVRLEIDSAAACLHLQRIEHCVAG
jgi:hypothetical protein